MAGGEPEITVELLTALLRRRQLSASSEATSSTPASPQPCSRDGLLPEGARSSCEAAPRPSLGCEPTSARHNRSRPASAATTPLQTGRGADDAERTPTAYTKVSTES